ncbi:MAG: peptidoglycan DD-metalloendopeptidase family protein [Burkholderiales bacterium]
MPSQSPPPNPRRASVLRLAALAIVAVTIAGCASRTRAPVEDRSATPPRPAPPAATAPVPAQPPAAETAPTGPTYVVKRGDTLFQIALDSGLDYRELAAWNNIENVNLIRVGQVLRLTAPGEPAPSATGVTTAPLRTVPQVVEAKPGAPAAAAPAVARNTDNYKSSPKALKEPYSEQAVRDVTRLAAAPPEPSAPPPVAAPRPEPRAEPPHVPGIDDGDDDKLDWVWPTKGKVVGSFSETANLKGIDIAGTAGQPVLASAAGTVVYAGTGLRGYGKLIIVKHNKTYLSAYAHNREILVKEGQAVTKGQKIAEMGNTDATEVKLHFEIRRLGKPMDPARYLPPA